MLFTANKNERFFERQMTSVPNFRPRSTGFVFLCHYEMDTEYLPYPMLIALAFFNINNSLFQSRLYEMIQERSCKLMLFGSNTHRTVFHQAMEKCKIQSPAFLSALFLLTADIGLWNRVKPCINGSKIWFDDVLICGISLPAYTLFKTAKDLYSDSDAKHINFNDLSDKKLIDHTTFALICKAMTIRRYGLRVLEASERNSVVRY